LSTLAAAGVAFAVALSPAWPALTATEASDMPIAMKLILAAVIIIFADIVLSLPEIPG
jgi:hypothetical protein